MSKEWINNCGSVVKSKSGGFYIKFDKDLDIKKGDRINMIKLEDDLDNLASKGIITEDEAAARKEKLHFIKFNLNKPPREDDQK